MKCGDDSEARAASRFADKSAKSSMLPSGIKKQNGDQGCSSTRKNMKLLRMTTG